jgi:hypothetical protein
MAIGVATYLVWSIVEYVVIRIWMGWD